MLKFKLFVMAMLFLCRLTVGQEDIKIVEVLDSLQYSAELPEDILKTKSLVLVNIPPKSTDPHIRGEWKKLAEQAQPGFKKAGIDVVVYYFIEDIYSGKESHEAFIKNFADRELQNIVFLTSNNGTYRIVLTKIQDKSHLVVAGQQAWKTESADLKVALDNLYKAAANSPQNRENLLILEVPEFGSMPDPIKGRRGEYYDVNFSSEKLALPIFDDTTKLNRVMAHYPYEYELVDPKREEKKLRSDGYQYILYYVHSTGKSVKKMLGYPTTDSETDYVSEAIKDKKPRIESYNINTPVYKFYIKHIYSGNVFLGKRWDAAPSWEQALLNYIDNLRHELIRD